MIYIVCLVAESSEEAVDDGRKPVVATRMGKHKKLIIKMGKGSKPGK
jgi:hypothetical protein